MMGKIKNKYKTMVIMVLICIALAIYFQPRTLEDMLGLANIESHETVYCGLFDISRANNIYWSGSAHELLGQSDELFGPLLREISVSGPVPYRNATINPDLVNLYFSLPKQDGTYQPRIVELILSYGDTSDSYSAFINIDRRGYFVTSGKSVVASFIQKARDTVTNTPNKHGGGLSVD